MLKSHRGRMNLKYPFPTGSDLLFLIEAWIWIVVDDVVGDLFIYTRVIVLLFFNDSQFYLLALCVKTKIVCTKVSGVFGCMH